MQDPSLKPEFEINRNALFFFQRKKMGGGQQHTHTHTTRVGTDIMGKKPNWLRVGWLEYDRVMIISYTVGNHIILFYVCFVYI